MHDNEAGEREGGRGVRGLSLMTFSSSEKLSNFKVHALSSSVNEFCTYSIINEKRSSNTYQISKKLAK